MNIVFKNKQGTRVGFPEGLTLRELLKLGSVSLIKGGVSWKAEVEENKEIRRNLRAQPQ
jgi:hypothetical protein